MTVDLIYPGKMPGKIDAWTEHLRMRPTQTPGQVELTMHSFLTLLAPGDVVQVADGCITEVVSLRPQWVYIVDLHLPKDFLQVPMTDDHPGVRKAEALFERWERDTPVTMSTSWRARVSTTSEQWFIDNVRSHKYVEHVELVRSPDLRRIDIP